MFRTKTYIIFGQVDLTAGADAKAQGIHLLPNVVYANKRCKALRKCPNMISASLSRSIYLFSYIGNEVIRPPKPMPLTLWPIVSRAWGQPAHR